MTMAFPIDPMVAATWIQLASVSGERKELKLPLAPEPPKPLLCGRNERCPCGSGRKYKKCHRGK